MQQAAMERFSQILSQSGYHLTNARSSIFLLLLNQEPQTMNQLITAASGKVDRVSVYRNIALFEKLGIVNRVQSGWKYKVELSDEFVAHHHHLNCIGCGCVIDIEDEKPIDEFIGAVSQKYGFIPRRHTFEIDGYCASCAKKS